MSMTMQRLHRTNSIMNEAVWKYTISALSLRLFFQKHDMSTCVVVQNNN